MHELSLAGGIVQLVEDAAVRERFSRVRVLRLEAGTRAGVDVRALRFALEATAPGSCLEGARIEIDEPAGGTALRVVELLVDDAPVSSAPTV
jgi:hydrogenase nickel incorporation protein HypA/HybF